MANHGFLTTRKQLSPERVDRDIREIVERRLGGIVEVTFDGPYKDAPPKNGHWAGWRFSPKEGTVKEGYRFEFGAWLNSRRKMEFRHPHGDWAGWAQMVIKDELAYKYDGTISDEGVSERWKVTPAMLRKYRHFRDWIFRRWNQPHNVKHIPKDTRDAMLAMELGFVPEPLCDL